MGENTAALRDMAAQLAAMLRVEGGGGMESWSHLHGKLAQFATLAGNDPRKAGQDLLKVAKGASSSQALMRTLEGRVSKANTDLLKDLILRVAHNMNMAPLGDSEPVQMVDEHGNFCEGNVDRIVKCSSALSAPNAPYAIVSIVGAQSSGKSYLLNRLFGTRFPEMDAKLGRSQTTRGIMMSRCIGPSLLLLDVEGFDGREKGQDTSFEKQATLFALTVSDLMMVNMSVFDIGREEGGGTQIFRTIFQERIKLPQGFTKILFVLRHYDGETPLDILRTDVQQIMEKIWERVHVKSVKFKDYIEVHVVALPDKNSPDFPKEVTVLRKMLSNSRSGKVPASSFSTSSSIFWETIKENKELDIPSHQVIIARLYCRRLVEDTLNSLHSRKDYKLLKDEESPSRFRKLSDELLESITAKFDLDTKMYAPGVRDKESKYVVEKLNMIFTNDAKEIIWKMKENMLERFKGEFDRDIVNVRKKYADLYGEMIVDDCTKKFMTSCQDLKDFDSSYLQSICRDLEEKMRTYTTLRIAEIKREHAKKRNKRIIGGAIFAGALTIKLSIFALTGIPPFY